MSTQTEKMIQQEQKEIDARQAKIEHLREVQYRQELIDVLSDKKTTEEQVAYVAKAFFDNYMRKFRIANIQKARANRKPKEKDTEPQSAV